MAAGGMVRALGQRHETRSLSRGLAPRCLCSMMLLGALSLSALLGAAEAYGSGGYEGGRGGYDNGRDYMDTRDMGRGNGAGRGGGNFRGRSGGPGSGPGGGYRGREERRPGRIIRTWDVQDASRNRDEQNLKELEALLRQLPAPVRQRLQEQYATRMRDLNEIYLQLGRWPEAVFADPQTGRLYREPLAQQGVNPVIGVTARVGKTVEGTLDAMAPDLLQTSASILLIGRPNSGKTTALREFARRLSEDKNQIVVVVDKTCEIGGDGMIPHPAIGNARWLPVESLKRDGELFNLQHERMREAVENQSPHVVIVDEISTRTEVEAIRTMNQRGIRIIAAVHGGSLPMLLHDPERAALAGGCHTVLLSGEEANRRKDKQKSVLMRLHEPMFQMAVEMQERSRWVLHRNVRQAVDCYFRRQYIGAEELSPGCAREVVARGKFGEGFEYSDGSAAFPDGSTGTGDDKIDGP